MGFTYIVILHLTGWVDDINFVDQSNGRKRILYTKWKLLQHPSRESGIKLLIQTADLPVTTKLYLKTAWAWLHFTTFMNKNFCKVYFFFLRSSNLLVRSSKSTSSLPALLPSGILSGRFGKSLGTAGWSGKLGPDEGRGALGAGGWWGAEKRGHVWVLNQTLRSWE